MASNLKPLCKFGEKCYRKNPQHLNDFRHPKRKSEEEDEPETKKRQKVQQEGKKKTIDDFFGHTKKQQPTEVNDEEDRAENPSDSGAEDSGEDTGACRGNSEEEKEGEEEEEVEAPDSPADVKENIRAKFLVDMPGDFYQFWDFCKAENPHKPCDALKDLGFQLVGPFDILAGNHKGKTKNQHGKRPNFLLHWRYYYDPPEFQTLIKGDDSSQFHLGYFRDDPSEMPAFVASNSAAVDCIISSKGDNLFAAVNCCLEEQLKSKDTDSSKKAMLKSLAEKLKKFAGEKGHSLDVKSKGMKDRDKHVVCKSFHKAGIVVPVDENEVGYREVPETPADLKKIFKKIADSKSEAERDMNYEPLQELITLIQFANDECDYGEGLELGMDLFCYGGKVFHSTILQLLPLAYMLLNRNEFGKIIEAHLKNRQKSADLSQL
ncbi:histone PARylation factor 1-like isoform X2 [Mya arenaria]|uniref:histone PARylation factor 1-like isoform X2 n=1 Tax=Mya arenaria TaxID=6604 RepID=UPI0022E0BE1A|nr:histone PARylation factor 1-like isoform X2 [Mya arenaria]